MIKVTSYLVLYITDTLSHTNARAHIHTHTHTHAHTYMHIYIYRTIIQIGIGSDRHSFR